ncbi:MAG: hypothetical protein WAQ75_00135 [Propionicimonas sp.]
MTTRSVDWSVVWTSSDDPIPGSPDTVASGAAEYQGNAKAVRSAIDYLDRLSLEQIKSDSIAKLAEQMTTVRTELDRVEERVKGVGDALAGYAEAFRGYQQRTMALWEEADGLQTQLDTANGDVVNLKRHTDRLGDGDEAERQRLDAEAADARSAALRASNALLRVQREFAGVVGERNTAAEVLKATLEAIDNTTPGKDSFWDKVQAWVNKVVTAVFEAVSKLIKAAVELIVAALKAIVVALIAVLALLAIAVVIGLIVTHPLLVLGAVLAAGLLSYFREHPELVVAGALMVAQGALLYMSLARAKRQIRGGFKECDQDPATIGRNQKLITCAESADNPAKLTGKDYVVVSDPTELKRLGITQDMLIDESSGFKATVFVDPNTHEYVIGFAGTNFDDSADVITDAVGSQLVTKQDLMAIRLARAIASSPSADNVTYVGHSLGGRLAAVAAIASGAEAVTYDPAGTSDAVVAQALAARDGSDAAAATQHLAEAGHNVTVYRVAHDPLNMAQEVPLINQLAPPAFGDNRYMVYDSDLAGPDDVSGAFSGEFWKDGHDLTSMKNGMENARVINGGTPATANRS